MDSRFDRRSPGSRLVLSAVLDLLATGGYDGLTVAQIATRSGPAGQALAASADVDVDVDDLVIAALGQVELVRAPRPTGSLRGDLLALLSPWRRPRDRDEMAIAAVLSAAEWRPSLKAAVNRALDRPIAQALGEILTRGPADGAPASWTQTLNWILRGLILERLRTGSRSAVDLEELVDFLVSAVESRRGRGKVAALELVPGHATTEAEIFLWTGRVPEAGDHAGPWVVLRTDDWPMSPATARELAGALLSAAERADAPVPASGAGPAAGEHR